MPQSDLVKVYVGPSSPPHEVSRIRNIGSKAHGLVAWGRQGQQQLILLDSDNAALVSLDPATGDEVELWQVRLAWCDAVVGFGQVWDASKELHSAGACREVR